MTFWRIAFAYIQNVSSYNALEVVSCGSGKKIHLVMTGGMSRYTFPCFSTICHSFDDFPSQTCIGKNKVIIYLQFYIDSTHVTSFGNVKYWGVFLWIGNVPKADRNDRGGQG